MKQLYLLVAVGLSWCGIVRADMEPQFEGDYVKMTAKAFHCGGVTFVAKPGQTVRLSARKYEKKYLISKNVKPGKILSDDVKVPQGGLRVRYDWAGIEPSHYRVYCERQNERGVWQAANCSEVIELDDVQHNRTCGYGPLGPSASYKPLNMKS